MNSSFFVSHTNSYIMDSLLVGLAVGEGTGPELMGIFEKVVTALATPYNLKLQFIKSSRKYHSYSSLLATNDKDVLAEETLIDADHYEKFCREVSNLGVRAIFRTSISAQALYMVRDRLQAVKVEHFNVSSSSSVMLVRDQAQGYYSGVNEIDAKGTTVTRNSYFSKAVFEQVLAFSIARAREVWGPDVPITTVTLVYKFHLFDGLFHSWSQEWKETYGADIKFIQGDTMNRNILAFGIQGHQLLISANEYADIMQTILLDRFGYGAQEGACAENIYLAAPAGYLSEYQTAHGSADDITNKGIVNPSATIRAAGALLERHGGCGGVRHQVDLALQSIYVQNIRTPDQKGTSKTTEFVDAFLQAIAPNLPSSADATYLHGSGSVALGQPRGKSCFMVMDFQNDFMARYKAPHVIDRLKETIPQAVDWARKQNMEVAFVRFLGDEKYQPRTWLHRNKTQGREPWCLEGSLGAAIASCVAVQPQDQIFDKKAHFDPFLSPEFERYAKQFDHLVIVGLYADVCVDAAVRGAFQRGMWTTVIQECMAGLHLAEEQSISYMQAVYGSRVISINDLVSTSRVANL